MPLPFRDRHDAGEQLAQALHRYSDDPSVLVLALPRGGVPVAAVVAPYLRAPLDLMIVRKLGFPGQEELALGAIATGGGRVINAEIAAHVPPEIIDEITERETRELRRREQAYRGHRPPTDVKDRIVILVDDGLATGATMLAAVHALRQRQPQRIVVAVPVAPPDTVARFRREADDIVCPHTPHDFGGVGKWYEDFTQTTDDEVKQILRQSWETAST